MLSFINNCNNSIKLVDLKQLNYFCWLSLLSPFFHLLLAHYSKLINIERWLDYRSVWQFDYQQFLPKNPFSIIVRFLPFVYAKANGVYVGVYANHTTAAQCGCIWNHVYVFIFKVHLCVVIACWPQCSNILGDNKNKFNLLIFIDMQSAVVCHKLPIFVYLRAFFIRLFIQL